MKIRDRIKDFRRVRASDLSPNPRNWRTHPQTQQDALRGILAEVGYADALLARELPDGTLELVDGHLRAETTPDQEVPVLVLDIDEDEAKLLLAVIDPLAAMAETNGGALQNLLSEIDASSAGLSGLLEDLGGSADGAAEPKELKQLDTQKPPRMAWVLIGLPTVRFGEISATIEELAAVDGIFLEMTQNDG